MSQPVGLSPVGVLAVVVAIGALCGAMAALAFGGGRLRVLADCMLGAVGAFATSVLIPMMGLEYPSLIGSLVAALLGASLMIAVGRRLRA